MVSPKRRCTSNNSCRKHITILSDLHWPSFEQRVNLNILNHTWGQNSDIPNCYQPFQSLHSLGTFTPVHIDSSPTHTLHLKNNNIQMPIFVCRCTLSANGLSTKLTTELSSSKLSHHTVSITEHWSNVRKPGLM